MHIIRSKTSICGSKISDEEDLNSNSLPYSSETEHAKTSELSSPYFKRRSDRIVTKMKSLSEMKKELLTASNPRQQCTSDTECDKTEPESETQKLIAAVEEVCNRSKTITKEIIECAHKTLANTRIRQNTITDDIKTFMRQHSFRSTETEDEERHLLTEPEAQPITSPETCSIANRQES